MKRSVKVVIIIAIILVIAIPVGVLALQQVKMTLYLPENEHEQTLTYRENTGNEQEISKMSIEEESQLEREKAEMEELKKHNEKALQILKKYNGIKFEDLYNKSQNEKKGKLIENPDQLSDTDKELFVILIDTCENSALTDEERQELKKEIEISAYHIEKIPGLKERMNRIINE